MTEQLSLFQTPEAHAAEPIPAEADTGALDELFRQSGRWRSGCSFLELLEFISRFPAYSPLNGFLIHLQDPAATRYWKPVAHLFHYAFKYPPLFLEGKGVIYNQPDLTETDHHG